MTKGHQRNLCKLEKKAMSIQSSDVEEIDDDDANDDYNNSSKN